MTNFSDLLVEWYQLHKRDLPWRKTTDPYKVWLSEIILQQTRVQQGLPYYLKFVKKYPTVRELAMAKEETILKLWQGLGYYTRARNMHFTAKYIMGELAGVFPSRFDKLKELKGVGDYTAAAIASFCFNEVQPVVDGNVYRVLARYFGIFTPINAPNAKKEFYEIALNLIDKEYPGLFNQALMEFGALHCKVYQPLCQTCPMVYNCVAFKEKIQDQLPIKKKKIKVKKRYFNYIIFETATGKVYIQKRENKDIWKNLFEFFLIETDSIVDELALKSNPIIKEFIKVKKFEIERLHDMPIRHKLTHQELSINFWSVQLDDVKIGSENFYTWKEILKFPFPIVIHNFIEYFLKQFKND